MRISKRTARKEAISKGYRSKFELDFSKKLKELKLKALYESEKIHYIQPEKRRTYNPDWTIGKNKYIEQKGRFTTSDRQKTLLVQLSNPNIKVYLIFQNSNITLSKVSNTTYGMWCDKNGIEWADIKNVTKWSKWFNE
jgi:Phage endonuclease I